MQKFKVGDKVRLLKDAGINCKGDVGYITLTDTGKCRVSQTNDPNELVNWVYYHNIELVEKNTMTDLKIEVGKAYKSVDGKKAVVLREDSYGFLVDYGDNAVIWHKHEDGARSNIVNSDPEFSLVSDWVEEPSVCCEAISNRYAVDASNPNKKTWSEMTPEEKGALLLAHHEGKVIEFGRYVGEPKEYWAQALEPGWYDNITYRVKLDPVVETVEMHSISGKSFSTVYNGPHKITYQTVDGEPDWSTIKGETL